MQLEMNIVKVVELSPEKKEKRKLMTVEICECGHSISEHREWSWVKPEEEGGRSYLRWVAKGQGSCSRCDCAEFKKKG